MKFNIDNYKGKYAMHCKTYDEAVDFCNYLHSTGRGWISGRSYYEYTNWEKYRTKTIYCFNEGLYCEIDLVNQDYTVLEWGDFMSKKEEVNCSNKTGIDRSKDVFKLLGLSPDEVFKVDSPCNGDYKITQDLKVYMNVDRDLWIKSVYTIADFLNGTLDICKKPVLTEKEQFAINYARACGCHWLAKDKDGSIYAYKGTPIKSDGNGVWDYDDGYSDCMLQIVLPISFLSWEDDEPYYIGD